MSCQTDKKRRQWVGNAKLLILFGSFDSYTPTWALSKTYHAPYVLNEGRWTSSQFTKALEELESERKFGYLPATTFRPI